MGIIPQSKQGDCTCCPSKNVPCVKRGKDLICFPCKNLIDNKKQLAKASERNKLRSLITYERQEGILDSVQELTLDIDRVMSRYVRLAAIGKDHKLDCYCCGKHITWQKAHAMHFINRQHMGTRFLTQNVKAGCYECNVEKRGNLEVYAEKLEAEQKGMVEWLTEQSRHVWNTTLSDLKEILFDFQQKLKLVETKLK